MTRRSRKLVSFAAAGFVAPVRSLVARLSHDAANAGSVGPVGHSMYDAIAPSNAPIVDSISRVPVVAVTSSLVLRTYPSAAASKAAMALFAALAPTPLTAVSIATSRTALFAS